MCPHLTHFDQTPKELNPIIVEIQISAKFTTAVDKTDT